MSKGASLTQLEHNHFLDYEDSISGDLRIVSLIIANGELFGTFESRLTPIIKFLEESRNAMRVLAAIECWSLLAFYHNRMERIIQPGFSAQSKYRETIYIPASHSIGIKHAKLRP